MLYRSVNFVLFKCHNSHPYMDLGATGVITAEKLSETAETVNKTYVSGDRPETDINLENNPNHTFHTVSAVIPKSTFSHTTKTARWGIYRR